MNKNLHRIIFNAARGERMVVAETATSLGKGRNAAAHAVVTALAFSSLFLLTPASAQIKADPSAPSSQRPVILVAPNGVPVVKGRFNNDFFS
ncbi:MAG: ESPR-type extended signal peptide-containing protein [Pseudomonadota bacterium]